MRQRQLAPVWIFVLSLLGFTATAQQQPSSPIGGTGLEGLTYTSSSSSAADTEESPSATSGASGLIRPVPIPAGQGAREQPSTSPFHSLAIGLTANTLGAGVEVATPLSRTLNLRSSFNFLPFSYLFTVDGVAYNSKLRLQSSSSTIDWFPRGHSFHISPGILYANNSMSAVASVGPGQEFELGDQPFLDSVDDPLAGTATVVFPHKIAPMVMVGFGNIIPRTGRHFSIPFEIGAAYTGAPQINVHLNGTACTTDGCVSFASNPDAQASLQQEISDINETLKRIPVYPIVSLGVAYHF
jgi:hypothetical protein